MERKYKPLFNLTVIHSYYESGRANDFSFSPTSKTAKDLSRFKLLARLKNDKPGAPEAFGLTTSYQELDGTPFIPITASEKPSLVFGVSVKNDRFMNITTELSQLNSGELFHYSNLDNSGVAVPSVSSAIELHRTNCFLRRNVFAHNFTIGTVPVNATLKILDGWNGGTELSDYEQNLSSENGDFQALVDLNGLDDGMYTVSVSNDVNATITDTKFYINNDLARQRPFAILDLSINSNSLLSGEELQINFEKKNIVWKYFVVFLKAVSGPVSIKKSNSPGPAIDFTETTPVASSSDEVTFNSLAEKFPTSNIKFFVSDDPVDLTETPVTDIQLKNGNGGSAEVLVKHLPGMPIENTKAEAYIFI